MVNFIRDILDPFAQAQALSRLRSVLILVVVVFQPVAFLSTYKNLLLGLFVVVSEVIESVCLVLDESLCLVHLATGFCSIPARLVPEYPNYLRALYLS